MESDHERNLQRMPLSLPTGRTPAGKIQGKENHFRKTHPRVFRLLERFDGQKPRIDIERALYFTESMRQTEGEHLTLRWAKALMHHCEEHLRLRAGRSAPARPRRLRRPLRHSVPRTGRRLSGYRRTRSAHPPAIPGVHHGRRRQARGGGNRPLLERQDIP